MRGLSSCRPQWKAPDSRGEYLKLSSRSRCMGGPQAWGTWLTPNTGLTGAFEHRAWNLVGFGRQGEQVGLIARRWQVFFRCRTRRCGEEKNTEDDDAPAFIVLPAAESSAKLERIPLPTQRHRTSNLGQAARDDHFA